MDKIKKIQIIRILTLLCMLSVSLICIYHIKNVEWTNSIKIVNINLDNMCTDSADDLQLPLLLEKTLTEGLSSDDNPTLGKSYKHKRFSFVYTDYNKKLDYYISDIYKVIGGDILRILSFNILNEYPVQLNIKIRNETDNEICNKNKLITFTDNILLKVGREEDLIFDDNTNVNYNRYVLLFVLNSIIGLAIIIYILYISSKTIYKEWSKAVDEWIEEGETNNDPSLYVLVQAKNTGVLDFYKYTACGPLFCSDNFVGSPTKNRSEIKNALSSCVVHYIMFTIILVPIIIFKYYLNHYIGQTIIFIYICVHYVVCFTYSTFYYLDVRWKYRKWIARIFVFKYYASLFYSSVYMINTLLWFLLSITVEPIRAIGMIVGFVTIYYYVVYMFTKLLKLRKDVKTKCTERTPSIRIGSVKRYGIKRKDMLIIIMFGTFIITGLFAWIAISWSIFNTKKSNNIIDISKVFIVPISAYGQAKKQIQKVKRKHDKIIEENDQQEETCV